MSAHRPRLAATATDRAAGPLPQMPARHKVTFGDGPRRGGRGKLAGMGIERADGMGFGL